MKLSISVSVNVKSALLKGHVLGSTTVMTVGPDDLSSNDWQLLVGECVKLSGDPPYETQGIEVTGEEIADLVSALDTYRVHKAERALKDAQEQVKWETGFAAYKVEVAAILAHNREIALHAPLIPGKISMSMPWLSQEDIEKYKGCSFDGYDFYATSRQFKPLPWLTSWNGGSRDMERAREIHANECEVETINKALQERVKQANLEALEASRGSLEAQWIESTSKAQEEARIASEARAVQLAQRLSTGTWEMDTPAYNQRRHGSYWVAKVTFPAGSKPVYEFGESTGRWGSAGTLTIDCAPGEIIAWGQKDLRRADRNEHHILMMRDDGAMESLTTAEAYKISKKHA